MRISFLHIPKTAGQSVHALLENLFSAEEICPARLNEQLYNYTVNQLRSYNLFSGHLDWSLVKLSGCFDFTFTVLRDPLERILSMYFYMREVAASQARDGVDLSFEMSTLLYGAPKDYFSFDDESLRAHIENYYNNVYTFYFSSGSFEGHRLLSRNCQAGLAGLPRTALENIRQIDKIYTLDSIQQLGTDLADKTGACLPAIGNHNVNLSSPRGLEKRITRMNALSPNWDWRAYFEELTALDYAFMEMAFAEGLLAVRYQCAG
jgi:hypothetical protein